ncbi:MAG: hypothetical protein ABIH25_02995 [Candidatus Woesearchaeota archaeon]
MVNKSQIIFGAIVIGALGYLFFPRPEPAEYFVKEGTFRNLNAIASVDHRGRRIVLDKKNDYRDDFLEGIDANQDHHFEKITLNNDDLSWHILQQYARDDTLELAYKTVMNQTQEKGEK